MKGPIAKKVICLAWHFPNLFEDSSFSYKEAFRHALEILVERKEISGLVLTQALINIFIHSVNMYGVTSLCHTLFKMLAINSGNKPDKSLCPSKEYIQVR